MKKNWDDFPQASIDRLVLSFENRLKLVIQEDGKSITNILRKSIHIEPNVEITIDEIFPNLSVDELIEPYNHNTNGTPIEFLTKKKNILHKKT